MAAAAASTSLPAYSASEISNVISLARDKARRGCGALPSGSRARKCVSSATLAVIIGSQLEDVQVKASRQRRPVVTMQEERRRRTNLGKVDHERRRCFTPRSEDGVPVDDIMTSTRRLEVNDVSVVVDQIGDQWKILGSRLNFLPETLESLQVKSNGDQRQATKHMINCWSQLPTATIGRLATVLWEMGLHSIVKQLET